MKRANDVAIFLPTLGVGGAERSLVSLAHGMVEQGITVDVVAGRADGALRAELPGNVAVVDLRSSQALTALPGLARYLYRVHPRSLMSCDHGNLIALWARWLVGSRARVVVTEHQSFAGNPRRQRGFRARMVTLLAARHYRYADRIVAVSARVADEVAALTRLPPDRIDVIHNPVRLARIKAMASQSSGHPWLKDRSVPAILGVGRLAPEKDFGTLIRAFTLVQSTRLARLVILGEGSERGRLEAMVDRAGVRHSVALPGTVANPFAYMAEAAVLVMSSIAEGLPQVLVEALACGCPVVATDCPSGPREILQDGKVGALVPMADPHALAAAIVDAIDRPLPRSRLIARADDFAMDRISRQYRAVLFDEGSARDR